MLTQSIQDDYQNLDTPGDPKTLSGDNIYGFLFSPSARGSSATFGVDLVKRFGGTTFVRGLSERISFETTTAANWIWRRIVFSMKGDAVRGQFPAGTLEFAAGSEGQTRTAWNFLSPNDPDGNIGRDALEEYLFQGERGTDWNDRYSAKVARHRVTVWSDFTRQLRSQNSAGVWHNIKLWHPFNKNIVYDQHEEADEKQDNKWSVQGKAGIGDIYVLDYFSCANGVIDDVAELGYSSTYYWHER